VKISVNKCTVLKSGLFVADAEYKLASRPQICSASTSWKKIQLSRKYATFS